MCERRTAYLRREPAHRGVALRAQGGDVVRGLSENFFPRVRRRARERRATRVW
jgi:hypothetical protein